MTAGVLNPSQQAARGRRAGRWGREQVNRTLSPADPVTTLKNTVKRHTTTNSVLTHQPVMPGW